MCFEVASRRLQSTVDAYSQDAARPQWQAARLYSGVGSAIDAVSPELKHYIARKAKEEVEVESVRGRTRMLGHVPEAVEAGAHPKAAGANVPKGKAGGKGSPAAGGQ